MLTYSLYSSYIIVMLGLYLVSVSVYRWVQSLKEWSEFFLLNHAGASADV